MPLAVLLTMATTVLVARVRRGDERRAGRVQAQAEARPGGTPAQGLRATLPFPSGALVRSSAARLIHGDPRHTARAHGKGPREVQVLWSTAVGGPVAAQVTASPDEQTLYVASLDGSLTALDRAGKKRWSVALGDRVYSTPCVGDDGTVYVGTDAKRFFAIASQGTIAWKLETDADADTGAMIAKDGTVVFAAGSSVFAVRKRGDVAWRFRTRGKVFTAPALTDAGLVIVGAEDDRVYAIRAGALAWSTALGADVDGAATIGDDGAIFVGTDAGEIVRLGNGGEIVWRTPVGGFVRGTLSLSRSGDVLAGTYGPVPRMVRVSPNGQLLGSFDIQGTGAREFGIHGGPLEDDEGTLFFGAQDDVVYAIDAAGTLRWKYATKGDVDAPLTMLSDGSLVVASEDGTVSLLASMR